GDMRIGQEREAHDAGLDDVVVLLLRPVEPVDQAPERRVVHPCSLLVVRRTTAAGRHVHGDGSRRRAKGESVDGRGGIDRAGCATLGVCPTLCRLLGMDWRTLSADQTRSSSTSAGSSSTGTHAICIDRCSTTRSRWNDSWPRSWAPNGTSSMIG